MEFLRAIFLDPERRLRTVWRFLIYGVGFLFIAIVVQLVLLIFISVWYVAALQGSGSSLLDPLFTKWLEILTKEHQWFFMCLIAPPSAAATFGLTLVCRKFLDWRPIWTMGYVYPGNGAFSAPWAGLIWGLAPILAAVCLPWLLGGYRLAGTSLPFQTLALAPALVLAAWYEEFVFRGYLLQNLLDIRRPLFGVIFTSLVFWIVHGLNPNAWSSPLIGMNLFGAGVLLALAYMASGNIWFPTALHFAWNFAQGSLLSVPISGIRSQGILDLRLTGTLPNWLTGGEFGLEGSLLTTLAEVAMIGCFLGRMKYGKSGSVQPPTADEVVSVNLTEPLQAPPEAV